MEIYPLHYKDNAYSWYRMSKLWNLYWPLLKPNFIIFAIYPFVATVLLSAIKTGADVPLDALLNIAITSNVCACPTLLTKRNFRDVCSQLPVTACEKLGFLLLTFWIVFPGVIYGSMYLGQQIGNAIFGITVPMEFICIPMVKNVLGNSQYVLWSLILIVSIIAVVLYYVVGPNKNRSLAGIRSLGAMYLLILLSLDLWSAMFSKCSPVIWLTLEYDFLSSYAALSTMIEIGIIGIIYLALLYKRLRNSGF